jgi:hypothetical protein
MSEYIRTTRECSISQFHPELRQALRKYFEEHELGDLQAEILMCCETVSRKKNTGKSGSWLSDSPDTTIYTGTLLTSRFLFWAHYGDRSGTLVNGANLDEIRAEPYTALFTKDTGLDIVGYISGAKSRVHGRIGMGTELAAQKFCEEVKKAITQINPPTKKSIFGW